MWHTLDHRTFIARNRTHAIYVKGYANGRVFLAFQDCTHRAISLYFHKVFAVSVQKLYETHFYCNEEEKMTTVVKVPSKIQGACTTWYT